MRIHHRLHTCALLAFIVASSAPSQVRACATCFGDPDSAMMQGAKNGAILLAAVVYSVLMIIAGIVIHWGLKAKRLADASKNQVPDGGNLAGSGR